MAAGNTASDAHRRIALWRAAAGAAPLIALLLLGEVAVYAAFPRPATPLEHFALFQDSWIVGLLTLDLLGMIAYLLFIPVMLALYAALHRSGEATMAAATALFIVGISAFFATNTAVAVLALSQEYGVATTEAERAAILAAGHAMFTLFNDGAFLVSYVIVSASWALVALVMLRSRTFGRATAYAGVLAGSTGIVAVVLEHSGEALVPPATALYFAAIVLLVAWVALIGRRLARLAHGHRMEAAEAGDVLARPAQA
jgi:hypothetical protein